jgi:hypothetical protein
MQIDGKIYQGLIYLKQIRLKLEEYIARRNYCCDWAPLQYDLGLFQRN